MVVKTTSEHRVVTAVLRRGQCVPLCHRSPERRWYPDAGDLPGGHVEDGEPPRQALMREIREELGNRISLHAPQAQERRTRDVSLSGGDGQRASAVSG